MDLETSVDRYHDAADALARGQPEGVKAIYSHRDDVTVANPFVGPPARDEHR
jgi:hypothetical protein